MHHISEDTHTQSVHTKMSSLLLVAILAAPPQHGAEIYKWIPLTSGVKRIINKNKKFFQVSLLLQILLTFLFIDFSSPELSHR